MKLLSFILAITICVLTARPMPAEGHLRAAAVHTTEKCKDKCCGQEEKDTHSGQPAQHDCCQGNVCNPFMSCSCCPAGFFAGAAYRFPVLSFSPGLFSPGDDAVFPAYVSGCFHPPEFFAS